MDPATGDAGYLIQGGLAGGTVVKASKTVEDGLGMMADFLGAQLRRIDYVDRYGNSQFRYQFVASGKFTGTALAQALEVITLLVMPLVEAIFQYLEDMHNPNLTDTQKLQRSGAVFVVMATVALGASMINPIVGIAASIVISQILWPMVSETVLDYYFGPTAMLGKEVNAFA